MDQQKSFIEQFIGNSSAQIEMQPYRIRAREQQIHMWIIIASYLVNITSFFRLFITRIDFLSGKSASTLKPHNR
jgi:hypothetical protein